MLVNIEEGDFTISTGTTIFNVINLYRGFILVKLYTNESFQIIKLIIIVDAYNMIRLPQQYIRKYSINKISNIEFIDKIPYFDFVIISPNSSHLDVDYNAKLEVYKVKLIDDKVYITNKYEISFEVDIILLNNSNKLVYYSIINDISTSMYIMINKIHITDLNTKLIDTTNLFTIKYQKFNNFNYIDKDSYDLIKNKYISIIPSITNIKTEDAVSFSLINYMNIKKDNLSDNGNMNAIDNKYLDLFPRVTNAITSFIYDDKIYSMIMNNNFRTTMVSCRPL